MIVTIQRVQWSGVVEEVQGNPRFVLWFCTR